MTPRCEIPRGGSHRCVHLYQIGAVIPDSGVCAITICSGGLCEITYADEEIDDGLNWLCQGCDVQDFSCCKAGRAIVGEDFADVDRCDFCVQVVFDLLWTTKVNNLA